MQRSSGVDAVHLRAPFVARLLHITPDGCLVVEAPGVAMLQCDCLATFAGPSPTLIIGDAVLVQPLGLGQRAVVLGRVGPYRTGADAPPHPQVVVEATQDLSLRCGKSSIDLRADGKVMIRGEDVLVRAKGTQRIRAGTVAIN